MIPYRDHQPSSTFPIVTVALIAINVLVFLYELTLMASGNMDPFLQQWAFIPHQLLSSPGQEWITIFSAMFMHGGWAHIIGNMLYLWIFGDNIEGSMGHGLYLAFYLLAGIIATFAQVLIAPNSTVPNLGASGAIAGVLGAYLVFFPGARVDVLIPTGRIMGRAQVSAIIVLGLWIGLQILLGVTSSGQVADTGGVAYFAHIGGFIAGVIAGFLYKSMRGGAVQRG